jgi:hypothetical protein
MSNRRQQIEAYVVDSRAELQMPPMTDRALGATTEQWYDRLRFIPDEFLGECYRLAMDNHANRAVLMPKEIVDQWHIVSARPGFREKPAQEKSCPNFCSAAGWYIVNSEGLMQKDCGSSDYLYAKPCPIHRPQGVRLDPHNPPGPRLRNVETSHVPSKGFNTGASVSEFQNVGSVAKQIVDEVEEALF